MRVESSLATFILRSAQSKLVRPIPSFRSINGGSRKTAANGRGGGFGRRQGQGWLEGSRRGWTRDNCWVCARHGDIVVPPTLQVEPGNNVFDVWKNGSPLCPSSRVDRRGVGRRICCWMLSA
eukprot:scaffold1959_cov162-Amphora_coffeaeformis.AAC.9